MAEKPDIVKQYERQKEAGEPMYFDPIELDDIFHFYAEENQLEHLPDIIRLAEQLYPEDPITGTLQAEYALNMGDASDCLQKLEPIFNEDNPFHCILRSGALAKLGHLTEAIEYAEKAIREEDPLIAYDLGLGFMNADQAEVALRYYSRCLDAYPDDLRTILGILYCLNQVGSSEEIIQYADRALEVDSFCQEAWIAKGGAYAEQEKWTEAEECYDYSLAIRPDDPDTIMMKANCCVQLGRPAEAVQLALEAADKSDDEQRANIYLLVSRQKDNEGQSQEAIDYVWKAVETAPGNQDLVERAAMCFADFGDTEAAIALLDDLYRKGKADSYLLTVLGEQYSKQSRYEEALPIYESLVRMERSSATYTLLAGTYMSLNKFHKAYSLLLKANELDMMWQTYVLLALCAHELEWKTAMVDNYTVAHCLNADEAKKLLEALSPNAAESFERGRIYEMAEQWRSQHLETTVFTAGNHVKNKKK